MRKLFEEYQAFTKSTAIYPKLSIAPVYPALGLADEVGELCEKVKHIIEPASWHGSRRELRNAVLLEVGDVAWYCARVLGDLQFLMEAPTKTYNGEATLYCVCLHAAARAGFVAGRVKKFLRDGEDWGGEKITQNNFQILDAVNDVMVCLVTVCRFLDSTIEEVLLANMQKLQSRKDRGVLQGDGDNR